MFLHARLSPYGRCAQATLAAMHRGRYPALRCNSRLGNDREILDVSRVILAGIERTFRVMDESRCSFVERPDYQASAGRHPSSKIPSRPAAIRAAWGLKCARSRVYCATCGRRGSTRPPKAGRLEAAQVAHRRASLSSVRRRSSKNIFVVLIWDDRSTTG